MTWTQFWDMHSGGGSKEDFDKCYIEAPEEEAKSVFYSRFGHNAERVSCTCCGDDYSISEDEDLAQLTGYHRNCDHKDGQYVEQLRKPAYGGMLISLKDYLAQDDVHVIYADDINPVEKRVTPPEEGYVWR